MLGSQRIQLKMSKERQALNELLGKDDPTDEDNTKIGEITASLDKLETEYRAYVEAEEKMGLNKPATETHVGESDSEKRALVKLMGKVELRHYVRQAIGDKQLTGAAAEFNQALKMPEDGTVQIPLVLLDPDVEKRADAVSSFQADTAELAEIAYLERIFAESLVAHLGINMHSVAAGEAFASVMVSGADASTVPPNTQVDAGEARIDNVTLAPVRMSAAYLVQIEDLARTAMIENRLRADLSMVMGDVMDNQTLNGDDQLKTPGGLIGAAGDIVVSTATHLQGNAQYGNNRSLWLNLVDGQYAATHSQIAGGLGPYYYNLLNNQLNGDGTTDVFNQLSSKGISFRSSRHVSTETKPSNNKSLGVICLKRGAMNAAIMAMWPSISLIRDIYTQAGKGLVRLTANTLWNFAIVRAANFKNLKVAA